MSETSENIPRGTLPMRIHAMLRYLRIENEHGSLSLTTLLVLVGCIAVLATPFPYGLIAFGVGWAAYQLKESREQARVIQAMETNHEVAIAKRTDDAEKLSAKMDTLEKLVKELSTPERQAVVAKMAEGLKAGLPLRGMLGRG